MSIPARNAKNTIEIYPGHLRLTPEGAEILAKHLNEHGVPSEVVTAVQKLTLGRGEQTFGYVLSYGEYQLSQPYTPKELAATYREYRL